MRPAQTAGLLTTLSVLCLVAVPIKVGSSAGRPVRSIAAVLALAVAGTAALRPLHAGLPAIPAPEQSSLEHGAPFAGALILAAVWLALAGRYTVRGLGRTYPLLGWSGLMLCALAVSDLGLAFADRPVHV